MNKIYPMKSKLTAVEMNAVEILKQIPNSGLFNEVIIRTAKEGIPDRVRQIFQMIQDQVLSRDGGYDRVSEIIGEDAVASVMMLRRKVIEK